MKTIILLDCMHWQRSNSATIAPGSVVYCVSCRKRQAVVGQCSTHQLWAVS